MPAAPWFKFYAADYLSSLFVQSLEPEQELWYLRLIIASAMNEPRGCLPFANGKLWRIAKAPSLEHFEEHAQVILSKFERDEDLQLYRVPKVFEQQLVIPGNLSAKRSLAGTKGAAKRWQGAIPDDGNLPSVAMANVKQKIADSDSDSDSDKSIFNPVEVAQILCQTNGWSGKAMIWALQSAIEFQSARLPEAKLKDLGETLVRAYRDYKAAQGRFAVGPQKFFEQGMYALVERGSPISDPVADNPATRALAQMEASS
jgi:hypothetical protein